MYMIVFIVAVVFNEYLSAFKECLIHIRVRWWGGGGIQAWDIQAIGIFICGSWTVFIFPSVGLIFDFQKPQKTRINIQNG